MRKAFALLFATSMIASILFGSAFACASDTPIDLSGNWNLRLTNLGRGHNAEQIFLRVSHTRGKLSGEGGRGIGVRFDDFSDNYWRSFGGPATSPQKLKIANSVVGGRRFEFDTGDGHLSGCVVNKGSDGSYRICGKYKCLERGNERDSLVVGEVTSFKVMALREKYLEQAGVALYNCGFVRDPSVKYSPTKAAMVSFRLDKDGYPIEVNHFRTFGNPILDEPIRKCFSSRLGPFPPLPAELADAVLVAMINDDGNSRILFRWY